jgi:hypothetical protein
LIQDHNTLNGRYVYGIMMVSRRSYGKGFLGLLCVDIRDFTALDTAIWSFPDIFPRACILVVARFCALSR